MRRRVTATVAVCALVLCWPRSAAAWDPEAGDDGFAPTGSEASEPVGGDVFTVPEGLYSVTDVYTGDVVVHDGPRTTYGTETVHESPGTFARVIDTVGSGEASRFDGASFNGRGALSDGRSVGGTYYETFVKTDDGYLSVNVVFFQDDAELAKQRAGGAETPPAERAGAATPPVPGEPPSAGSSWLPSDSPVEPSGPERRERDPQAPGRRFDTPPATPRRGTVTLRPVGAALSELEVLRGRTVAFWLHAFAGDAEVPVLSWSLVRGDGGNAVALGGSGAEPFVTSWDLLAEPADSLVLRFALVSREGPAEAAVSIIVRSPALTA